MLGAAGWGAHGGVLGAAPLVLAESLPTQVKFGSREWVLGRVEYDTRASDVPLSLILPSIRETLQGPSPRHQMTLTVDLIKLELSVRQE